MPIPQAFQNPVLASRVSGRVTTLDKFSSTGCHAVGMSVTDRETLVFKRYAFEVFTFVALLSCIFFHCKRTCFNCCILRVKSTSGVIL